ncbi:ABC transporter substrate-binding protein [Allokutzneria sp. A3M-2-11 16]|uniref:ABC transporter substrate-binding protein n=1 Tax=Allokutzneria sp. A3M-2-11 16 TaxID=2962043 RepID=UPI0020B753BD|nr:ABC transporter substrate-binding protein [Allokutzneria sp. A3M-2-11 16]MCP3803391.1 ABC transporter substrate-binding protein [Allokutzneria sp. A3M-2-11 16]
MVLAAMALLLGSACTAPGGTQNPSSSPSPAPEKKRIRLGVLPVLGAAPLHLAIKEGAFAREGLEVDLVTIQGAGAAIPDLATGNLDIVFGNYVSFFTAEVKQTAKVKLVADGYFAKPNTWMVLSGPNSRLSKPTDLVGKKVAVTTTNSLADLTIKSTVSANGGDEKSITFVEMPYTEMGEALNARRVDAALLSEPFITETMKKIGALPVFDAASGPTADIAISGYATTEEFATSSPKTVAAFQRALSTGVDIANRDRSKVEAALIGYSGIDQQTASILTLVGFPGMLEPERIQRVPDLMHSYGTLERRLDVKPMIIPHAKR